MISFEEFPVETQYGFRKYLDQLHPVGIRNEQRPLEHGEIEITEQWKIVLPDNASTFLQRTALDLRDYFSVALEMHLEITTAPSTDAPVIRLISGDPALDTPRSFIFHAAEKQIRISGFDDRGCAMGVYYLEDLLSLRENPYLDPVDSLRKEPLFSPRIIHSGYEKTKFTEPYLRKAAHYGFDAIILYTNRENDLDFTDIIDLAEQCGLDTYFYSKFPNPCHPSLPEAKEHYRKSYGDFFRKYPKAKGILFVGESMKFPTQDPQVLEQQEKCFFRFSSSNFPCDDYPQLLRTVKDVINEAAPGKDVIFWTYNFGNAPEDARLKLMENLPADITVQVNFALHDIVKVGDTWECPLDYSLGLAGPSKLFRSEAEIAAKRGLKLFTMANSAGKTWDFGTIPYIPAPYQWLNRYRAMLQCREQYGLSGLLESHSYGWQPSVVSELAKWMFWSNAPDPEVILEKIALRNAGPEGAPHLLQGWKHWSDGMENYPMPIEDQYGPCRVGPAYPLYFTPDMLSTYYHKVAAYPKINQNIVFHWYRPTETAGKTEGAIWRIPAEIRYLADRIAHWEQGIDSCEQALQSCPEQKRHALARETAIGCYICNTLKTTRNVKRWWLKNTYLMVETDPVKADAMLDELLEILREEYCNAEQTIPLLRCNSALGFECAMEYPGDEEHIRWKLGLLEQSAKFDIPAYRKILQRKNMPGGSPV